VALFPTLPNFLRFFAPQIFYLFCHYWGRTFKNQKTSEKSGENEFYFSLASKLADFSAV
jgi:hypothetical protein